MLAAFVTLILITLSFLCDWFMLKAVGVKMSFTFVVMAFSFSTIAGFLSPLPGGLGVREISNAYLFKMFYNLGEIALIVTVLRRALDFLLSILLYGYAKIVKLLRNVSLNHSALKGEEKIN